MTTDPAIAAAREIAELDDISYGFADEVAAIIRRHYAPQWVEKPTGDGQWWAWHPRHGLHGPQKYTDSMLRTAADYNSLPRWRYALCLPPPIPGE